MYLKSLELQGFKSFPDKIKLDFNKGLTAVVGPNGSGKSNIGDAVRWVLGEQSSKTLRGSKMEDVIFAGTQLRKPVGFAQVTLNIDNSKHVLGIPADVVNVTRKLYRSGESEYLINGSQVRLKDICELFMDTGLGRDGYSIIGQGRIAEIVSAKSNERREIFEEAAGISKFRYKKAEAERNLTNAQDNILRLNDIIGELESRVEPLRIQSEKANQFIELSKKKKSLEISFWIKKLDELKLSISGLEEKILINNSEYENIDSDILRLEDDIQKSYKNMQESNVKIETFQANILEAEKQNGQVNSEIAVLLNDISHENAAIEELVKQKENAKLSYEGINEKIQNEKDCSDRISDEIVNVEKALSDLKSELEGLLNETESIGKEYEESNSELNRLYIKQSEYRFSITSAETSIKDAESQLAVGAENENELKVSIEKLSDELKDIDGGLKGIEENIQNHNNKILGYTKLFSNKSEKLDELKKAYDQSIMTLNEKQQRKNLLSELEKNMEGFSHSVKEIIQAGNNSRISGIFGSVAQLISIEDKYSTAVETALGAALQNIIVRDEETAKRCIRHLKDNNAGRATFLPVTSVKGYALNENGLSSQDGFVSVASEIVSCNPEFSGIIQYLLGRIVIAEDIDSASVISKKYGYKFKIVTLDGQVINAGGSFTGGSVSRSSGVLTRKNEISELENQIKKLSDKLSSDKILISKLQAEVDKLNCDIEGEKEQLSIVGEDKIRFTSEQKRIEAMTEQFKKQLETTVYRISELKNKKYENEKALENFTLLLEKCGIEISEKEKLMSESGQRKDDMHQKREKLSTDISSMKIKETELQKDRQASEARILQLEENSLNLADSEKLFDEQIALKKDVIEEKDFSVLNKKTELEKLSEKTEEYKKLIEQEQKNHRQYEQSANEKRSELKAKNDDRERYSREITKLEERKNSVEKDYDAIISDMWEQYSLTRSDAQKLYVEIEDMPSAQKQLNELKSKIRNLGTVNVAAIEEYKEVFQRYNFLSEQLKDVETSKKELEKLIFELTEEMRKRFSESFEQINENFKSVFSELFGGGKAELTLTNPQDVLESGIEINVAPPGKVIKNLSLLSGGEQSFVAIAIYFAILKIKPAPFCILDEIEAALDDVNVVKYAQYLRRFTDTTQFILVTHRRGTMEEADTLYGVTMQEKGISKLLKMDQSEIHNIPQTN